MFLWSTKWLMKLNLLGQDKPIKSQHFSMAHYPKLWKMQVSIETWYIAHCMYLCHQPIRWIVLFVLYFMRISTYNSKFIILFHEADKVIFRIREMCLVVIPNVTKPPELVGVLHQLLVAYVKIISWYVTKWMYYFTMNWLVEKYQLQSGHTQKTPNQQNLYCTVWREMLVGETWQTFP